MNKVGRPKGFKPLNPKRPKPCMRDAGHAERRKAKTEKLAMLSALIAEINTHKPVNFNRLRGIKRRHKKARRELEAMRP